MFILSILDLFLSLQELPTKTHLHEEVLRNDAHATLIRVAQVLAEVLLGRHLLVQPQHVPRVDHVLVRDARVVCDLVD